MNHSAFRPADLAGGAKEVYAPFRSRCQQLFFNPAEFIPATLFQAVFSFCKNGGDLCASSLNLSITFFRFPEFFPDRRYKVIVQFCMSEGVLCSPLPRLSITYFRFAEMIPASQLKVIIQFCMSGGDLCPSFRTPSITFFRPGEICFACVPFRRQCRCAKREDSETIPKSQEPFYFF